MGFFSAIIDLINQPTQDDLLRKANSYALSFDDKFEIARKLDREHVRKLYHDVWFRDPDGLRAIVASGKCSYEIEESIMLRTDVPVDVSKRIIRRFDNVNEWHAVTVLTRFFSETNQELIEVLKRCLQSQRIQFPRDKDKEVVKCCLDKYVNQFIKEHSEYVNDICHAIENKCSYSNSTLYSSLYKSICFSIDSIELMKDPINRQTSSTEHVSDKRKEMFRQRFGEYIKEYAFKEISYDELTKKIERYLT